MSNEIKLNVNQSRGYENAELPAKTISSREVAEMMEVKKHSDMLAKIDKLNEMLKNGKIRCSDYWIESIYKQDGNGKENREYQVTKKGCELIAHKTVGEKGVIFTVKYMERFEQMETHIQQQIQLPTNPLELLELSLNAIKNQDVAIKELKSEFEEFKDDLPLLNVECDRLTATVKKVGTKCLGGYKSKAYDDKSIRAQVYSDIHTQIKREFGVNNYKAIKRNELQTAIEIINSYKLPHILEQDIYWVNNQMSLI